MLLTDPSNDLWENKVFVLNLADSQAQFAEIVGGKAASLAKIIALGVPSPNGFCITTDAYFEHLSRIWSDSLHDNEAQVAYGQGHLEAEQLSSVRNSIQFADASTALRDEVTAALVSLEKTVQSLPLRTAIRSSATNEDSASASFAGQHDTFLNVLGLEAIVDRIKACWASFWSDRAYKYRVQRNLNHWTCGMGTIVEEFIAAEVAGTLFTSNPVTNDDSEAIIEATYGLGELLVSGRITPDRYYVDLKGEQARITSRIIKAKRTMLVPTRSGGNGTEKVLVQEERVRNSSLDDQSILELVKLGRLLSVHFAQPLDIEWAKNNGQIQILQARPITSSSNRSSYLGRPVSN